ncbi:MAG: AbrB/MazE/SpoVT family DNA-binding domain-containing protein [Candidatus Binatia bacterium]
MKITSKGQVTIPLEIRQKLGLLPNTEVEFTLQGNTARLVKASAKRGQGVRRGIDRTFAQQSRCQDEHRRNPGVDTQGVMKATLGDSNVLLDVATSDARWFDWSSEALESAANESLRRAAPP